MRSVEIQIVHTQAPAVERAYQTRHAQADNEQRQAATIQKQDVDAKLNETQETDQTEQAKIQLEKEREKNRKRKKRKKEETGEEVSENMKDNAGTVSPNHIDIKA
ncbi:hypothetical protein IID62_01910 [candidate division KSB1 bacterium]|nr:hypothetical protein [candidate division KSB1 bacterium]